MVRHSLAAAAFVALGFSRDAGCSGIDNPNGGPNAPCTRSSDCGESLVCLEGVCREREPDPGDEPNGGRDSGIERDASALIAEDAADAGDDGS